MSSGGDWCVPSPDAGGMRREACARNDGEGLGAWLASLPDRAPVSVGFVPRGGGDVEVIRVRALTGWWSRLVGLLGARRDCEAGAVVLAGCSSIHTYGMRCEIDAAFADAEGLVLRSCRGLPPCRIASSKGASFVLERPSAYRAWPHVGSRLTLWPAGCQAKGTSVKDAAKRGEIRWGTV